MFNSGRLPDNDDDEPESALSLFKHFNILYIDL